MALSISVIMLVPHRMGEEAELVVRIAPDGENAERADVRRLFVASKMLFEIGNIGIGSLPYALTEAQFDTLEYDASLWEAVKKGIDILSYGDNTKASLITKLRQRGFERYLSEDAAEYIAALGYIDERRMLTRAVEQLANTKLYGPSRIRSELHKKGISRVILDDALDTLLAEIDFDENLRRLLAKKCDMARLCDPKYRESVYAAMYRLGYSPSDTRAAIKILQENEHE